MPAIPTSLRVYGKRFVLGLDWLTSRLSLYAVPFVLAVATIIALAAHGLTGPHAAGEPLAIRVATETAGEPWTPAEARGRLAQASWVSDYDTRLSEAPVWISLQADGGGNGGVFALPSRHAQSLDCWGTASLAWLGSANRESTLGELLPFRAGFTAPAVPGGALCRVTYSGPAEVKAEYWHTSGLAPASLRFYWGAGLFEGALVMLALFALLTAWINREKRYLLLAVWLIGNLRLGAISTGWDTQWLGFVIPADWMHPVRQITIAAYYLVTYALFCEVFRDDLAHLGGRWVTLGRRLGLVLLAAALFLPFSRFLPIMWVIVSLGAGAIVAFMLRCLWLRPSRTVIWYSAALGLVLFASVSEVVAAALDFKSLMGMFNSVTAALAASVLAAFAFADQVRQERRDRRQAQAELERTYQVTPIGLFTLGEDGRFVRSNRALRVLLGSVAEREGLTHWEAYFEPGSWQTLQRLADGTADDEIEIRGRTSRFDEAAAWYLVRVARAGPWIEGSLQDITERRKLTERLQFLANNDSLTGVLNRRGIERHLEHLRRRPPGGALGLAYLDLDRFKLINDLYGHQAGDEVLRQVCRRISGLLPEPHRVGRIGGDEFIVVFDGVSLEAAADIAGMLIEAIAGRHFHVREQAFQVNVSVGLIELAPQLSISDAISTADRACRDAKARRPGPLVTYERTSAAFRERAQELRLIEALGGAFATDRLFLVMQPIVSLRHPAAALDFEVLVRMHGEDGEVISAGQVLAAAEANGKVALVDRWVLRNTLSWLRRHQESLPHTRFVCVNLSGASLNDESFLQEMLGILGQYADVAPLLCLEVTEGVALHDIDNSQRFIEQLRQFGPRIALDDFGAGYTSFRYLKDLSADALKVDGAFVRSIHHHPANVAILEAIVQLARNLGMRSIAEWVENTATLEILVGMGVDYVQGYLLGPPQTPEAILAAESAIDFVSDPQVREWLERGGLAADEAESLLGAPVSPHGYH